MVEKTNTIIFMPKIILNEHFVLPSGNKDNNIQKGTYNINGMNT